MTDPIRPPPKPAAAWASGTPAQREVARQTDATNELRAQRDAVDGQPGAPALNDQVHARERLGWDAKLTEDRQAKAAAEAAGDWRQAASAARTYASDLGARANYDLNRTYTMAPGSGVAGPAGGSAASGDGARHGGGSWDSGSGRPFDAAVHSAHEVGRMRVDRDLTADRAAVVAAEARGDWQGAARAMNAHAANLDERARYDDPTYVGPSAPTPAVPTALGGGTGAGAAAGSSAVAGSSAATLSPAAAEAAAQAARSIGHALDGGSDAAARAAYAAGLEAFRGALPQATPAAFDAAVRPQMGRDLDMSPPGRDQLRQRFDALAAAARG